MLIITKYGFPAKKELSKAALNEKIVRNMRAISHNHLKLIEELFNYAKRLHIDAAFSDKTLKTLGITDELPSANFEDTLKTDKDRIATMPKKKLLQVISYADRLSNEISEYHEESLDINSFFTEDMQSERKLRETIDQAKEDLEVSAAANGLSSDEYFKALITGVWPMIVQIPRLLMYGIILFPHEQYTRYFDGTITPEDYIMHHVGIGNKRVLNALLNGTNSIINNLTTMESLPTNLSEEVESI